jgi:hypothetical protein
MKKVCHNCEKKEAKLHRMKEKLHHMAEKAMRADEKLHKKIENEEKKEHHSKKHNKIEKVMHEYGEGKLHSGSKYGPTVKNRKQALAIAFSEARRKHK